MITKWRWIALSILVGTLAISLFLPAIVQSYTLKQIGKLQFVSLRELSNEEKNKVFLFEELLRNDKTYRDFRILKEVIKCESDWKQFREDGSVVISKGNIGLGQINRRTHEKTYTKMGLDMSNPYDNLKFIIYLYKKNGLKDWEQWSGHCWLSKIKKL